MPLDRTPIRPFRSLALAGLLGLSALAAAAQAQTVFQRQLSATGNRGGYPLAEGGYILAGGLWTDAQNYNYLFVRFAADGSLTWSRSFDFNSGAADNAYAARPARGGGFVAVGSTYSTPTHTVALVKVDGDGNHVFSKTYGTGIAYAVDTTADGGFILAGGTGGNVMVLKTDSSGNLAWGRTYFAGTAYAVARASDGGYIVAASTAGTPDIALLKLDASGNAAWARSYGAAGSDGTGSAVVQTSDGGYAVLGSYDLAGGATPTNPVMCLLRTASDGTVSSAKLIRNDGGPSIGTGAHIARTADGGLLLAGTGGAFLKLTSGGAVAWTKSFGGGGDLHSTVALPTSDGGAFFASHIYLAKTGTDGNSGCAQRPLSYRMTDTTVTTASLSTSGSAFGSAAAASPAGSDAGLAASNYLALPSLTVNTSGPTSFCGVGSVTLTPVATVLSWSDGSSGATLTATSSGSYYARVVGASGCVDSTAAVTVTQMSIPPAPGSIRGRDSVCAAETGVAFALTPVSGASSYQWSLPPGASVTAGANSDSIVVTFGSNGGTVMATPQNSCGSSAATATKAVAIRPAPSTASGRVGGPALVCRNQAGVRYGVSGVAGAASYAWTVPAGATITSGAGTDSITVTFGTAAGNVTAVPTNACGSGASGSVAVSFDADPVAPGAITGDTVVCAGATGRTYTVSPVAGASSYQWTVPAGAAITSGQGTNSITVTFGSASGSVEARAVFACGTSSASALAVRVKPLPAAAGTIRGPAAVCANASAAFAVSPVSGATGYTWAVPFGASITSGQGTDSITVTFGSVSGDVTVTPTNDCGSGTPSTLAATVGGAFFAAPDAILGDSAVCPNAAGRTYSVAPISGAVSYQWTAPAGGAIASGQGSAQVTVDFGSTSGSLQVRAVYACGQSSNAFRLIAVTGSPVTAPGPVSGDSLVCAGARATYSIAPVSGATGYQWTVPAGATLVSGQGTTSAVVDLGSAAGDVAVRAQFSCGTSPASARAVAIRALPAQPAAIQGPPAACAGSTGLAYSVAEVAGATGYAWTLPAGAVLAAGTGTRAVGVDLASAASGTLAVKALNACGAGPERVQSLAVLPLPAKPVITRSGNQLTASEASAYQWYYQGAPSAQDTGRSLAIKAAGAYRVRVANPEGCQAFSDSVAAAPLTTALGRSLERGEWVLDLGARVGLVPTGLSVAGHPSLRLRLEDLHGKALLRGSAGTGREGNHLPALATLPSGMYILAIEAGASRVRKRIVLGD